MLVQFHVELLFHPGQFLTLVKALLLTNQLLCDSLEIVYCIAKHTT